MTLPDTINIESSIFTTGTDPHHKQVNSYFSYREIECQPKEEPHLVDEILSGKIEQFEEVQ